MPLKGRLTLPDGWKQQVQVDKTNFKEVCKEMIICFPDMLLLWSLWVFLLQNCSEKNQASIIKTIKTDHKMHSLAFQFYFKKGQTFSQYYGPNGL